VIDIKKEKLTDKLKRSPINYFSDLFIVAMVSMWIVDNIYQAIVASIVTISSVVLSAQTGMNCYDTSMWASIGTNVAIPLSCGGAVWMVKNSVQHAISNYKGKEAAKDFPAVHPDGEYDEIEIEETLYEPEGKEE
jgi:hypothetical protein